MPLTALNGKGELLMSMNCEENVRNEKLNCPHCNEKMVFVNPYQDIIKHFRHKRTYPYSTEPESMEHIAMKAFFCGLNWGGKPEIKIGNRIADVVFDDIVVECQVSTITMRELIERTQSYNSAGYHVAWVLHPKNFLHAQNGMVKPRKIEKFLHHLSFGRVYYFLDGDIVPMHYGFEYGQGLGKSWRFLKIYKELHHSFNFIKSHNMGLKTVLFGDSVWWK
jgi:competence CoiA-like predicted nuclease